MCFTILARSGTVGSSVQNFPMQNELRKVITKKLPTGRLTQSSGGEYFSYPNFMAAPSFCYRPLHEDLPGDLVTLKPNTVFEAKAKTPCEKQNHIKTSRRKFSRSSPFVCRLGYLGIMAWLFLISSCLVKFQP